MIKVDNLTKKFTDITAVDNISFEVSKCEIVGFLGPNGAGKTTTLRMITGFLAPDNGKVTVAGLDIETSSAEIKSMIGYLPEDNPLYEDMAVCDYLLWSAKIKGLTASTLKDAVKKAVEICSLHDVIIKPIGTLSKGYKRRVGIANAILHNPKILLLDEPTSGLDPNQARQMRELIKNLGKENTVILSTHILSEAKEICDKIMIMNKGVLAASGTTKELLSSKKEQKIILAVEKNINAGEVKEKLTKFGEVTVKESKTEFEFTVESQKTDDIRKEIFNFIIENKIPVLEFKKETVSLDELFRKLTL